MGMEELMRDPAALEQVEQMMQNPMMQQMMQDPAMVRQIMAQNPMAQQMMQNNPQMAAMLENPEFLRQLSDPNTLQQMMQMQQGMRGGGGQGMPGGLAAMMGGVGAPGTAAQPPEERFRVQLEKLRDMGFTDQASNIVALQATSGNLDAAIDRLLAGM